MLLLQQNHFFGGILMERRKYVTEGQCYALSPAVWLMLNAVLNLGHRRSRKGGVQRADQPAQQEA